MQPSSFPASIGDAAIVSAASARADHMHVPQDIAGFHDSVAEIASEGRVIEISGVLKNGEYICYEGDPLEPGLYAATIEFSAVPAVPLPSTSNYAIGNFGLEFTLVDAWRAWFINTHSVSSSGTSVSPGTSLSFSASYSNGMDTRFSCIVFVKDEVEFSAYQTQRKARFYMSGTQYSERNGQTVTATARMKLRKLA